MDGATTVLFQYGLAGVVILGLSVTVVALYKDNQRLHVLISDLQNQRRTDAVETQDKVAQTMNGLSSALELLTEKVTSSKGKR